MAAPFCFRQSGERREPHPRLKVFGFDAPG